MIELLKDEKIFFVAFLAVITVESEALGLKANAF
jgi:hypothetical protein